jgi:hypothetical protein
MGSEGFLYGGREVCPLPTDRFKTATVRSSKPKIIAMRFVFMCPPI